MDSTFYGFLLFEQVHRHRSQDGKVLRRMVFADATGIFPESDIQRPMQLVLNAPTAAFCLQDALGWGSQTGDEIAGFDFDFVTYAAFGVDHG